MKKLFYIFSTMLLLSVACKNDDPEPEAKRATIYDTTKVIDRYTDSIFHHFYDTTHVKYTDSIYHHFYDTLSVYDTIRVPILCDHSYVVYVLNNGTDEKDSLYIKNGATITLKSDVIRSGYDLVKWSTSPNGGSNDYEVGDDYYVNDDITLYAIWQSRDGLRSNEVYDFLAKQEEGSTVDVKIIDINPDFDAIKKALQKFWRININLDIADATISTINDELSFFGNGSKGCTNLLSIKLPHSLKIVTGRSSYSTISCCSTIPAGAFNGCSSLTNIDLPTGVEIVSICNCTNLTSISIPSTVKTLCIYNCPSLAAITIPNSVNILFISNCPKISSLSLPSNIQELTIQNLASLEEITIPHSVTKVSGFIGCTSLTTLNIPENVEEMQMVFDYCKNLKSITHKLKACSMVSFESCEQLTTLSLPEFRTDESSFWGKQFDGCNNLTSLTLTDPNPPTIGGWICYSGTIYVPSSAVNAYKTADIWKDHADQIVGY